MGTVAAHAWAARATHWGLTPTLFSRNLGKSGLRVSCLGLGECGGPSVQCHPRGKGLWEA